MAAYLAMIAVLIFPRFFGTSENTVDKTAKYQNIPVVEVLSGDRIKVKLANDLTQVWKLKGIETFQDSRTDTTFNVRSQMAKFALASLVGNSTVSALCDSEANQSKDRVCYILSRDGTDLAVEQVAQGHAWADANDMAQLANAQQKAIKNKSGFWLVEWIVMPSELALK